MSACATLHRDAADRIARIEHGITGGVLVKGEPVVATTIEARMKALQVPDVSVAVIENYRVAWVRAWGATPETLFQGGSMSKSLATVLALRLVERTR